MFKKKKKKKKKMGRFWIYEKLTISRRLATDKNRRDRAEYMTVKAPYYYRYWYASGDHLSRSSATCFFLVVVHT